MKAVVFHRYGSPDELKYVEVPKPTPDENEVLVKIHAASVNAGDWRLLRGDPFLIRLFFGLTKPKINILGVDIAGKVEQVGGNVTQFQPGDKVFGDLTNNGFGGFAEYTCVPPDLLLKIPNGSSYEEAATLPLAAVVALQGLRDHGNIQPGQKVLINGASGNVGLFAVQIAKSFGAEVTGVCSTGKMELVHSLGADHVIDYTRENFTANGKRYDLILDTAARYTLGQYKRVLNPGGAYIMVGGQRTLQVMSVGPLLSALSDKKFKSMLAKPNLADLAVIKELVEGGKVKPVIDKRFGLSEVPTAIRTLEQGHAHGKIVITM
ncbi:MAG TPA: NAD(P)-dependent alcohol dehydrogenase [bacterium]|nr:NAD(P)-dependent alcohol dehydrogenase [bacterium]